MFLNKNISKYFNLFHIIPTQQRTCEIIQQEEIIIPLSFCFSSVHSLYKYYCLHNSTITHFNRNFTSLLPPEKSPFLFVFDCSCVHMWLQWKSFFVVDYAVFSLHTLFYFFWNAAKIRVATQSDFIIYDPFFLLGKLDLKDKISKITSKNKNYWGREEKFRVLVPPNENLSSWKKVRRVL